MHRRLPRTGLAAQQRRSAILLLSPWVLGVIGITVIPVLASLYFSLTDYNLLTAPTWIGLDNYRDLLFNDPRFITSVVVTAVYSFVSVPLQLLFALGLALFLNKGIRGLSVYRSLFYLPSLLGGSVAIAILWRQVFGPSGIVNDVLARFGVTGPDWLSDPSTSLSTLIVLNVWMFGSPMVIFLASLRQIPQELYEAAECDGAGRIRQFFSVTFPLLTPILFFNLVLQFIHAFQAFTPAFIVSGGRGGPADSTLFYSLYLYQEGFANLRMGYASAMAWLLLLITALFTAANFAFSKVWVYNADD